MRYDTNKSCNRDDDPTEPDLPGGFGWLDPLLDDDGDPVGCLAEIEGDDTAGSDTGNNGLPSNLPDCHAIFTESLVGQSIYIPIFDTGIGSGSGATVHLKHYAKVALYAWMFGGGGRDLPNVWDNTHLTSTAWTARASAVESSSNSRSTCRSAPSRAPTSRPPSA